ncbi:PLP-dependent aminotransferase family protein [Candidatus Obscuribacterales bacterium]|nr:PLP-dependent aminotransferase family protein [Candidatus Obscuribacterales bacterium]
MDFPINISSTSDVPLHRQIYEELRRAILSGRLARGKRVPSTREMSKSVGVARATVSMAYDYLLSEGYFEAYRGSGTYVSRQLPDELLEATDDIDDLVEQLPERSTLKTRPRQLSQYGQTLQSKDWLGYPDEEPEIQFTFGRPDLDEFPARIWSQLLTRHCRSRQLWLLDCPTKARGYTPLRNAIADYLAKARAVICDPDQIIIVNGSQQALDLVTRVLVDPGDIVGIEEPGYIGAQKAFHAQGAKLSPVFVDSNGVRVDFLKSRYDISTPDDMKLLYVTPSHQYPTGVSLSLGRRLDLLAWASRTGTIIIEDDYDSEYRYKGKPIPALAGIDSGASVIYIGTFSKVLLPALRLGYLVVPKDLIDVFARAKWLNDRHSSLIQQQVLSDFITEGHMERHIRRMRALYGERRLLMIEALKGLFGSDVTIYGENAGINMLVRFNTDIPDDELVIRARNLGVGISSTRYMYLGDAPHGEYLLNYGGLKDQEIIEGLTRLRAAMDRQETLLPVEAQD